MPVESADAGPVLFYDGVCGFCAWSVQFVLDHDRLGTMRFAALQSATGRSLRAEFPELNGVDSVILVIEDSAGRRTAFARSSAAIQVCRYLGGFWQVAMTAYVLPRPVRDFLYDQFAKRRYRLFGRKETCMVPDSSVRARFIDIGEA